MILRAVDELETFMRTQGQQTLGRLRLGIIPTVAPYFLPELMTALQTRYPGIELRPREAITQKLLEDLQEGLDAAILALPLAESGLESLPLIEEEFVLVRPAQEADHPVPSAEGLRTMRLLLLEEGIASGSRRWPSVPRPWPRRAISSRARRSPPSCRWSARESVSRSCRKWQSRWKPDPLVWPCNASRIRLPSVGLAWSGGKPARWRASFRRWRNS